MLIRNLTPEDDLRKIAVWYAKEWVSADFAEQMERNLRAAMSEGRIFCMKVALEGRNLIGVACLQQNDMGAAHLEYSPWLAGVYVDHRFRGKKIGKQLSKAILSEAYDAEFRTVYLFTDQLAGWYSKLGWHVLGDEIYKGKPVTVMKYVFQSL